jgi:hypothetical protein
MDMFGGIKGEAGGTLADAYRLAVSKLENTGAVTQLEKELIALRLISLVRQGVKRPDILSEAAIEFLRRKRTRIPKKTSDEFMRLNGTQRARRR